MTLIEVVVAIALVGIMAVGFLSVYVYGSYAERRSGDRTKNVANAETVLENKLGNQVIASDPVAKTVTIGSNVYQNAVLVDQPATVTVTFDGSATSEAPMAVTKSTVSVEADSVQGKVSTTIEVFKK